MHGWPANDGNVFVLLWVDAFVAFMHAIPVPRRLWGFDDFDNLNADAKKTQAGGNTGRGALIPFELSSFSPCELG